jgi:hypothetical protein
MCVFLLFIIQLLVEHKIPVINQIGQRSLESDFDIVKDVLLLNTFIFD